MSIFRRIHLFFISLQSKLP